MSSSVSSCVASDPYMVLGVPKTASLPEIRQAYKQKALEYHPDKNPGGEDRFKAVVEAYACLGSDASRRQWDRDHRGRDFSRRQSAPETKSCFGTADSPPAASTCSPHDEEGGNYCRPQQQQQELFHDVYEFDHAMASKKGGFFSSFSAWRAHAEAEKVRVAQECEARVAQARVDEEEAKVRERAVKKKQAERRFKDTLEEWQQEISRWEEEQQRRKQQQQQELEQQQQRTSAWGTPSVQGQDSSATLPAGLAGLEDKQSSSSWADDILAQIKRARGQQRSVQRVVVTVPTEQELDAKPDAELEQLEDLLQSRLSYIRELKLRRRFCVACSVSLKIEGTYSCCGHAQVTCEECRSKLLTCPKCYAKL